MFERVVEGESGLAPRATSGSMQPNQWRANLSVPALRWRALTGLVLTDPPVRSLWLGGVWHEYLMTSARLADG